MEAWIDRGAAGLFALACAFPAIMLLPASGGAALAVALLLAGAGYWGAVRCLRQISARHHEPVCFDLTPLPDFPRVAPLELAEQERFVGDEQSPVESDGDIDEKLLELEDSLPTIGPGSRVVQLFGDPSPATAGELALRIDRHLARRDDRSTPTPDASDELFDALNQLRRSLR